MCGEQGFIAMHETVHLIKFIGKGCLIFFRVLMLRYSTTGYKVLKYSSRIHIVYLAARTTTEQTYTISGLCQYWCAFHRRYSVTGLREAHLNSIFSS